MPALAQASIGMTWLLPPRDRIIRLQKMGLFYGPNLVLQALIVGQQVVESVLDQDAAL